MKVGNVYRVRHGLYYIVTKAYSNYCEFISNHGEYPIYRYEDIITKRYSLVGTNCKRITKP